MDNFDINSSTNSLTNHEEPFSARPPGGLKTRSPRAPKEGKQKMEKLGHPKTHKLQKKKYKKCPLND